ncbi:hypothetical protein CRG98_029497 [Punica granatum]|uniref:Pectinesterase n=1 Tax=Punica granatum TaxID=22663 RepID=A0A2I0J1J7_PUNGR|nr:hypothetical protein CRG98_029497 [Punica granatum]
MGNNIKLLDKLLYACFLALSFRLVSINGEQLTSCAQTPYPDTCNYYLTRDSMLLSSQEEKTFAFHDLALRVTMDHTVQVHRLVSSMDVSSFDGRARSAWSDCLELYEDTMHQLNRSMSSNTVNPRDSQTWLSATITNHVTCQNGFKELKVESNLQRFPNLMLTNFSRLLSNSLAINKGYTISSPPSSIHLHEESGNGGNRRLLADGFPSWVSASDRKLLQSTAAPKADLVVANDGSGDFKTISEAVAASAKRRSGDKRFVIYVKAGTYNENVEIKRSMKNLMIVGDGKDATVVTGSRNAKDGSTTFRSATFVQRTKPELLLPIYIILEKDHARG